MAEGVPVEAIVIASIITMLGGLAVSVASIFSNRGNRNATVGDNLRDDLAEEVKRLALRVERLEASEKKLLEELRSEQTHVIFLEHAYMRKTGDMPPPWPSPATTTTN